MSTIRTDHLLNGQVVVRIGDGIETVAMSEEVSRIFLMLFLHH